MIEVHVGSDGVVTEGSNYTVRNQPPVSAEPLYKVCGNVTTVTTGEHGGVSHTKVSTVTSEDLAAKVGGILGSARNNGSIVQHTSQINDKSIVVAGGISMSARSAANAGLLIRFPDGTYGEADGNTAELKKSSEVDDDKAEESKVESNNPELISKEAETTLESLAGTLGGFDALDRHALSAIAGLTKGDITHASKSLATATGNQFMDSAECVMGVYEQFRDKSAEYIARHHGVDGEACFEWAGQNLNPSELSSLLQRVYLGKSSALDGLAAKYIKALNMQQSKQAARR